MDSNPAKTLSDRIEETVEGLLRFALRLSRTIGVILFKPIVCDKLLLCTDDRPRRYVRPLTFLAIGGFIFSIIISVYPKGFLGLVNIFWFDDEVGETIFDRWQEAVSITGLLLAAFPALLTVSAGAALAGQVIRSPQRRSEFFSLSCYLFGYQCFLLFSFLFFPIIEKTLVAMMGIELKEVLGIERIEANEFAETTATTGLIALFLSALAMPSVGLSIWAGRALRARPVWLKSGVFVAIIGYSVTMLAVCSYAASAPAAFKEAAAPKAKQIEIHFLEDPIVRTYPGPAGEHHTTEFDLRIAIENAPTAHLIASKNDVTVGIVAEFEGEDDTLWSSWDFTVLRDSGQAAAIVVEKGGVEAYQLTGTVSLPPHAVELIRQRSERPLETNNFNFYINIRLSHDSEQTDRRLFLDADTLMPQARAG